jgi:hypothetical protein
MTRKSKKRILVMRVTYRLQQQVYGLSNSPGENLVLVQTGESHAYD